MSICINGNLKITIDGAPHAALEQAVCSDVLCIPVHQICRAGANVMADTVSICEGDLLQVSRYSRLRSGRDAMAAPVLFSCYILMPDLTSQTYTQIVGGAKQYL